MLNWLKRLFSKSGADDDGEEEAPPQDDNTGEGKRREGRKAAVAVKEHITQLEAELLAPLEQADAPLTELFDDIKGRTFLSTLHQLSDEDPGRAVRVLRRFEQRLGDHIPLLVQLARVYESRFEHESMRAVWERILKSPRCTGALRHEGYMRLAQLFERNGEPSMAFLYYQRALVENWDDSGGALEACLRLATSLPNQKPAPLSIVAHEPPGGFTLEHPLGRGGYGTVYLGTDEVLGRAVAMKFLHPHLRRRPDRVEALFEEARLVASLGHPGIVQLYELDMDRCLIVMEYMTHGTLADRLASGRSLHIPAALDCAQDICQTLAYVHQQGVLHRDIKPGNVLFRRANEAVLGDFGIAGLEADSRAAAGTQRYAAPEVYSGGPIDRRADLYGVGVMLVEMLTGTSPPLRKGERAAWMTRAVERFPQALRGDLEAFLSAICAPAPQDRPPGAEEVVTQIADFRERLKAARDTELALRFIEQAAELAPNDAAGTLELMTSIEEGLRQ